MLRLLSSRENNTLKPLAAIALPMMLGNAAETVYNLTDTWFLGRLGPLELAAPSVSFTFIMLIILMGSGLGSAGTTLIARSVGQKSREKVDFYLGQMTTLLILSSLFMGGLGFFLADLFLSLINTPQSMMILTGNYLRIVSLGIPFMYGFFVLQAAMQGTGHTMVALRIQLLATAVNIPLDALLIFGGAGIPSLGVEGAALATIISRAVACGAGFFVLIRGDRGTKLVRRNLILRKKALKVYLGLGIPSALSHMGSSLGFTVMHGMVNTYGSAVIAAFGVVNRVHAVFYMPVQGLARSVTTMVGQSLGAKDEARADRSFSTGVVLALLFIIPGMIFCFAAAPRLVRFFVDAPDVIRQGSVIFRIISPSVIIFAIFMICVGAFQGAGDTRSIMLMYMGRLWGIRLPLAWLLSGLGGQGEKGIWYAMFLSNLLITLIGYGRYKSRKWVDAMKKYKDE